MLNLKKTERKLTESIMTQKEQFWYLFANWAIFGFLSFIVVDKNYDNPGVLVMLTILPLIGLVSCYRANIKGDGKQFLSRFISLHFVVGIRFLALILVTMLSANLFVEYIQIENEAIKGFSIGGLFLFLLIGFYRSLYSAMKRIAQNANVS